MSRVIMVHSSERPIIDVFNEPHRERPKSMINDLKVIWALEGQFNVTEDFGKAMHDWKTGGFEPVPNHPKLAHYASRRFAHLLKLTMISSVDRSNELILRIEDFKRAKDWLISAEATMPFIFKEGSIVPDSKVMDEIAHFVQTKGEVSEHLVRNFASQRVPAMHIEYMMKQMEASHILVVKRVAPKTGLKTFVAPPLEQTST